MDYLTLAPGLPPSSRLGFGCGGVMGRVGRAQSLRAIAAALDGGITHFDVARLYGYGEAEALVGEALRGRRGKVVIASKFGLSAPRVAGALKALKPLAQRLAARVPGARAMLRSLVGGAAQAADRFSVPAARAALDQSLMALQTDYLDIWFLHDCAASDLTGELKDFLDAQIASGKIRAYGIASDIDTVRAMNAVWGDALLYQFPNSVTERNAEKLPAGAPRFICHSPFAGSARVPQRLAAKDDAYPMMLAQALAAPGVAVVLCSMLDEAHLAANLAAVETMIAKPIVQKPAA
jgi:aryl-alcohol dehydrogenase-like predicted oxidoreductase